VSKTVVAARLGVKKETLSRLLRELADDGVIAVAQRNIAILDRARLAQVARSR
jgi:CRP-like cAMP-binding protein